MFTYTFAESVSNGMKCNIAELFAPINTVALPLLLNVLGKVICLTTPSVRFLTTRKRSTPVVIVPYPKVTLAFIPIALNCEVLPNANTNVVLVAKFVDNEFETLLARYLTPVTLALVNNISLPGVIFPVDDIVVNAPLAGVTLPITVLFKLPTVRELKVATLLTVKFATATLPVALKVDTMAAFPPSIPNGPWYEPRYVEDPSEFPKLPLCTSPDCTRLNLLIYVLVILAVKSF